MLFFAMVQFSACLNEDNRIPPNCYDGILNNDEELVDCGGPNCPPCDPCENGVWEPELGEQWVDCGGDCPPCDIHFNGQLDPGEDCIDCGGITGVDCGELCNDGLPNGCEEDIDCGGQFCEACPNCEDETMNGEETGIDCGGPECDPCPDGVDCTNGVLDLGEIYIDCGGPFCNPCEFEFRWRANGINREADVLANYTITGGNGLSIDAASSAPAGFSFTIPEPATGWSDNANVVMNPANAPATLVIYTDGAGTIFSSENDNSNLTVTFQFANVIPGGVVRATFSGTLFSETGTSVNITEGFFFGQID
jgi:hypothetical protein